MNKHGDAVADLFASDAFRCAQLRSERLRIAATAVTFLTLFLFTLARSLASPADRSIALDSWAAWLSVGAIVYELIAFGAVTSMLHSGRRVSAWAWFINVVIESALPTMFIVALSFTEEIGPYRALVAPVHLIYVLLLVLATLRLNPWLCLASGVLSAVGYGVVVSWTFLRFPDEASTDAALHGMYYATTAFIILLSGGLAAGVAKQIRGHVSTAIREEQARHLATVRSRDALIFGLARLAEYRDTDTGTHLERIATYVTLLAETLSDEIDIIDDAWIKSIGVASSMHDIGKVGIPDRVLQKPGRLTAEERKVIEEHPQLGAAVLESIQEKLADDPLLAMCKRIAASHHERWDGTGYPDGVAGDAIDLAARVVAVADVYDALTSARVYKPPMTHDEAVAIIDEGSGSQFDPAVVAALHRVAEQFDALRQEAQESNQSDSLT